LHNLLESSLTTVIECKEICFPALQRLTNLASSIDYDGVEVLECRRSENGQLEAVLLRVRVPLGQKITVHDIHTHEDVAVVFSEEALIPAAYPAREDFPFHVPHVNVSPRGFPRSLCLSADPIEDQIRGYTPLKFVERIRWWLVKTAYGELHGDEQPLDAIFHHSPECFFIPENIADVDVLGGFSRSAHIGGPIVLMPMNADRHDAFEDKPLLMTAVSFSTNPAEHGRMQWLPGTAKELLDVYHEINISLLDGLKAALFGLVTHNECSQLMQRPLVLVISTELTSQDGRKSIMTKAFVTVDHTAGDLTLSLGIADKNKIQEEDEHETWTRLINPGEPDITKLGSIRIATADIHRPFTPEVAATASSHNQPMKKNVALIGAGAVGSHFGMALARGGVCRWQIMDNDHILPHNQARYALDPIHIARSKAEALAAMIDMLFKGQDVVASHVFNMLEEKFIDKRDTVLADAERIVDASASVPVARLLANDAVFDAPVTSIFLNPTGTDAVMLSEPTDRSLTIDCVEMHYYWLISTQRALAGHLQGDGSFVAVGGCRSPSARIPETRVSSLTGLVAGKWLQCVDDKNAQISVWRGSENFSGVKGFSSTPPNYLIAKLGHWTVKLSSAVIQLAMGLRVEHAPKETGGIVIGTWDRIRKIVYVAGIFDAPPNSEQTNTGFVRGSVGVHQEISDVLDRTLNNLTYVGEWHSHPPSHGSQPSADDDVLLRWIGDQLKWSEAPALMLIAGEDGLRVVLLDKKQHSVVFDP
jgi:integrative and conjugative element protein (TIGR02256 family)